MRRTLLFLFLSLAATRILAEKYETTYRSSPLAILPLTILSRSASYDPSNTTLFLACPAGLLVSQPGPAIYDSHGALVWADPSLGADGRRYLTMWVGVGDPGAGQLTGNGIAFMLDEGYEVVKNVSAVNPDNTDAHEFHIVGSSALVTAYHAIPADLSSVGGPVDGWYLNSIFQEIDIASGNVLFNWTSFDHIAFSESYNNLTLTGEGTSELPWDAVHINSIDKGTKYLISSRNCKTLYKIDKNGTIAWRLGGKQSDFKAIGNDTEFHWQHHARWRADETQISLFDNAAAVIETTVQVNEPVASGKFFAVDQKAMTYSAVARFLPSPYSSFSLAEGSVEPYGSTVVTGFGENPWLVVRDSASGSVLLSAILGPNTTLPIYSITNYRFFQMSTLEFAGHPTEPPSVAVDAAEGAVYVSWNGATHVAEWVLLTGASASAVGKEVARVRKSGFETKIDLKGSDAFVKVAGIASNGTTLGTSAVYRMIDERWECCELKR
ncbi:ASST-domain-containing protein [Favolaschia claudopus]|uniref:ASST-domain-containing protein n=1 Tax=Favolaschia claudopus TaxID=2862362 RepID=A0AAV9ZEM9_9AGAR